MTVLYTNNAATTLAASISDTATSFSVASGTGSLFPAPVGWQWFYLTLVDSGGNLEIVKVTGRTDDTMTVERAQDGTTALAFTAGSKVELRITKLMLDQLKQDATSHISAFTDQNSVWLGMTPVAPMNGVAIGAEAMGYTNGVAIGYQAFAQPGDGSIAIGSNAISNGGNAIALGKTASANAENAIAIGDGAQGADYAIALGFTASTQQAGIAVGYSSVAGPSGVAVGVLADASGPDSTAIGTAKALLDRSLAIGGGAESNHANSIVLNASTEMSLPSQGSGLFVKPIRSESNGQTATGVLKYNTSTGEIFYGAGGSLVGITEEGSLRTALGLGAGAGNSGATAIGGGSQATGYASVAIGMNAAASNQNLDGAISIGIGSTSTESISIGSSALTGAGGVAIGISSYAHNNGVTLGNYANAYGSSVAIGSKASASVDDGGIAIGYQAKITGLNSIAIGGNTNADTPPNATDQTIIGYNAKGSTGATVIGFNAGAFGTGFNTTIIGTSAGSTADQGIAVGVSAAVNAPNGIAVGANSSSDGEFGIALGHQAQAGHNSAIVINGTGIFMQSQGDGFYVKPIRSADFFQTAAGTLQYDAATGEIFYAAGGGGGSLSGTTTPYDSNAYIGGYTALGTNINTNGTSPNTAVVVGSNTWAGSSDSVVIGHGAAGAVEGTVEWWDVTIVGAYTVGADLATAIGSHAIASSAAVAVGYNAAAGGSAAIAIGNSSYTNGSDAIAIGSNARVWDSCEHAIALGKSAYIGDSAHNAIAIGNGAQVWDFYTNAIAIGAGAVAANMNIVLNASGSQLEAFNPGFYVKPIRDNSIGQTSAGTLQYDSTTGEVYYSDAVKVVNGNLTAANGYKLNTWTITESGGVLYFAVGGTNKAKLDSSGNFTVVGNVTAYGTV